MTAKTTKPSVKKPTALPTIAEHQLDPAYKAGAVVRETAVATAITAKNSVVDAANYVGSKIVNFGKGLFNVHPAS